ncbi:MAG: hypothetical protein JNL70_10645 [Saprospiraceae bacterium]|nr:hypothetical protein [Saprospiraceae bacterium]
MKAKKLDLDIDIIGGEDSLTLAEEKALSDFFKQRKLVTTIKRKKTNRAKRPKTSKRPEVTV